MERQSRCKLYAFWINILLVCALCFAVSAESADSDFEINGTTLVKYYGVGGVVTVPDGITEIGEYAFCGSAVSKIILPETLKEIRSYAFMDCYKLKEITLPASLTNLEYTYDDQYDGPITQAAVFSNNQELEAINVAEGNANYTSIDGVLFTADGKKLLYYPAGKNRFKSYAIPEGTEEIGYTAFSCVSLSSIELPSTLTTLNSDGAFCSIHGLKEITVNSDKSRFYSVDGVLYQHNGTLILYPAWKEGESLKKEDFPRGLTSIGSFAFQGNEYLKTIELPDTISSVGWMAFMGARSLKSVTFPAATAFIAGYTFSDCMNLQKVTLPGRNVSFPEDYFGQGTNGANVFSDSNSSVVLCGLADSNVQAYAEKWGIKFEALNTVTKAEEETVTPVSTPDPTSAPDPAPTPAPAAAESKGTSIFEVMDNTLYRYYGNEDVVVVPDGIEVLGEWAFDECIASKIILPETLREIGCYCFFDCPNLSEIVLPASLEKIGEVQAFNVLPSLKRFKIAQGNKNFVSVDGVLFSADRQTLLSYPDGKNVGGQYSVPEGTRALAASAFSGASLVSIHLPSTLTTLFSNGNDFSSQSSLKEITVSPDNPYYRSVDGVLYDYTNTMVYYPSAKEGESLGKDDFPEWVRHIGAFAFQNNQYLKSIEFPEGVTSIGWMCTTWASSLETISIPASVNTIEGFAFAECPRLKEVILLSPDAALAPRYPAYGDEQIDDIVDNSSSAVLYGYEGSTAQEYAQNLGIPFKALSPAPVE